MRRKNERKAICVFFMVLAISVMMSACANAELVTISISAEVNNVEDIGNVFGGAIQSGDIITGYYTYDSDTSDTNPSTTVADYWQTSIASEFMLSVKGLEFRTDASNPNFLLEIVNDNTVGGLHDAYGVVSYENVVLTGGTIVEVIYIGMTDYTATALLDTSLPIDAPTLSDWEVKELCIETSRVFRIDASLTSIELVPEPASIFLIAIGAMLIRKITR